MLIITYELQPYPALCRSFLLVLVLCSGLACCIITSSLSASAVAKGQSSAFSRVWYSHGFRMAVYILLAVEGGVAWCTRCSSSRRAQPTPWVPA